MVLSVTIMGRRCDLALHPISKKTATLIHEMGREIYKQKYIHWWRKGNTSTCGLKLDDDCMVKATLDGQEISIDYDKIGASAVTLRRRIYLDSKAKYLCVFGSDDEHCSMTWRWDDVTDFDPEKFEFFVLRWDRVLKSKDFLVIDDIRYDGRFADDQDWGGSCGFSLVDPVVIDLEEVRREIAQEEAATA